MDVTYLYLGEPISQGIDYLFDFIEFALVELWALFIDKT
jgi:hypothetical protein